MMECTLISFIAYVFPLEWYIPKCCMYCPGMHAGINLKIIVMALAECVSARGLGLKPSGFLFIHFPGMNAGEIQKQ